LPADSGEFQLVSSVLGIAHPPGYPLYTMLGKLFTLLPLGDPAWCMNLYGAVCGALTLAVVARMVRRETNSVAASWLAAGALGLSATFWAQSTTTNIRSLTALFTAISVAMLHRWGKSRQERDLALFVFCFGLGVGHHASLGLLALPMAAYVLAVDPHLFVQPRRWPKLLLALLLSLLPLAYLPIRSLTSPVFDPSPIHSWAALGTHVLALGFRGDMLHYRTLPVLWMRVGVWAQIIKLQFGVWLLAGMALGAACLWRRQWRLALLLCGVWLINTLSAITYRAPQTVEYLIPSYVALALLMGCGLGYWLQSGKQRPSRTMLIANFVAAVLGVVVLAGGWRNLNSFQQLHRDNSLYEETRAVLDAAPRGALILSNWHQATAYWYVQHVEERRADVEVCYVYPEGATANEDVWLRRIADEIDERPVLVTNYYHAFDQSPYLFSAFHGIWQVGDHRSSKHSPETLPSDLIRIKAEYAQGIHLLGYALAQDAPHPGQELEITVYWRVTQELDKDYSTFLQLLGPSGVIGQGDINHASSGRTGSNAYTINSIQVDTYRFPLLQHTPPGDYQLITGFYYGTESGGWERLMAGDRDHVTLTTMAVQANKRSLPTQHELWAQFEGGLLLEGMDVDQSLPDETRLYLHWRQMASPPEAALSHQMQVLVEGKLLAAAPMPHLARDETVLVDIDLPQSWHQRTHVSILELCLVSAGGSILPQLGPWHRRIQSPLRLPSLRDNEWYIPLGGEMALVSWPEQDQEVRVGEKTWFYPQLTSVRPLTHDYSISLGLLGNQGYWEFKSDGTPALGMIPTLKWLSGWHVQDPRGVVIEPATPLGDAKAQVTFTVYDAFTLRPLHVLDERRVRLGQGTSLILAQIPVGD